ncbi:carbohydrate-binding module family 21 protein [Suhomyces tanzawaensis NRRL Y-17324]|uniref:Carbohydrate-binding module family 21 protein n=1 Tax=Suhomyces tanzawaensis NRRL Y-17324 TaxID=984487 RepID=A0A1E4SDQ0_9ASCO|nr:carbohydrate-binding module family 21 protein [Suhomyces tanzawaensis NRRL Y-17324]ODV77625.1 carbohydrate-binding module family 21 protein [Suhomyces tanzawaensis NRRL Y-17324]
MGLPREKLSPPRIMADSVGDTDPPAPDNLPIPRLPFTYGDHSNVPLSMRFIHKPSRSQQQLDMASDPTRRNSITNRSIDSPLSESLPAPADSGSRPYLPAMALPQESVHSGSPMPLSSPEYRLVRKKSGEVLKPSLKDSSSYFLGKRSQSLPTTPTYKQVHFGCDTDVRYFKKKDKPSTISASNSPTLEAAHGKYGTIDIDTDDDGYGNSDDYTDDTDEEDYHGFNLNNLASSTKYPDSHHDELINWQLNLLNFAPLSYSKRVEEGTPVFLERLFLTVDKKFLLGHIAVQNMAFEKHLTVRYSLDNWLTIIEIPTLYMADRPDILKKNNYDRFTFQIPLDSLFNSFRLTGNSNENTSDDGRSQERTYELCIKYNIKNQEFWDNNNFKNYSIKLIKTVNSRNSNGSLTQINQHAARPKYSSSYLKRRGSDSQIEIGSKDTDLKLYHHDNSSSDINDFVKNNFYLSSPLLSSLHNPTNSKDDRIADLKDANLPSLTASRKRVTPDSPTPKYKSKFNQANINLLNSSNSNIAASQKPSSRNYMDPQDYKQLLDKYCFFSSDSTGENRPDTISQSSEDITTNRNPFEVSSFLRD